MVVSQGEDLVDEVDITSSAADDATVDASPKGRCAGARILVFGLLPTLVLLLSLVCGFLKWQVGEADAAGSARAAAVQAAADGGVALLSYKPDTVDNDLNAARDRLTGDFRNSYDTLIRDVVIPGAREQRIASIANVVARGAELVSSTHAQVLLFINQTVTVGDSAPTSTASSVKVSLDRMGGRWLISAFDPV
ncbi:putative protein [Mycolicibacterium vanbaalenii]|uniref:Outer membrane protein n=1 Tax=Mycolicibacterium vanbaalenii TaxID=110539 RepID=A0A5S9R671_MYCVN|nr:putative protein [Mycolicibacterium vanbaalenii]